MRFPATSTQKQNKITINRSTLYGSGVVMYRTGATKIFPIANEYNTFSWYYLKYGTGTGMVPLRRIILVRHNDKHKKTIKKVYPTSIVPKCSNAGKQINLGKVVYISLKNKHKYVSNCKTICFVP